MMTWLLKHEGYPSGVVVAFILHALLIYIIMPSKFDPQNMVKIEQPSFISATVTKDNPQRVRQLQELDRQRQQEAAKEKRTQEAAKAAEEQKRQQQAKLEADKKEAQRKVEAEAQAKKQQQAAVEKEQQAARAAKEAEEKQATARREAEQKKQAAQQQAARETAAKEAAANQAQATANAQAMSAENQLIAQYTAIIQEIVSSNWIQPPSARNGMQVLINIKLVPTGEIVSSSVIQSSGDAVFDRSALQAVQKAGRFPDIQNLPPATFERNFRNFTLLFSPEDLLR